MKAKLLGLLVGLCELKVMSIIREIMRIMQDLHVSLCHVLRSQNNVANKLAR